MLSKGKQKNLMKVEVNIVIEIETIIISYIQFIDCHF